MARARKKWEVVDDDGPDEPSSFPASKKTDERWMSDCEAVIDIVSAFFNVSSKDLRNLTRSVAPVARVRQIGMYVAHTVLQVPMKHVARCFVRDRTTVQHAVALIEDLREDSDFDGIMDQVDRLARVLIRREPV
ncbi:helix-turn-helix domain-containing protein [Aliihoeflea sp. PC F10.4]